VSNLTNVVEVAAGNQATYALRTDGTVWAWGWNTSGELGTGSPDSEAALTPVRIPTLSGVVAVASGSNTGYAVKSDGTLWSWGWNGAGQLGTGQECDPNPDVSCESRVPVQVPGLTGVSRVVADGSNTYALRTNGTVAAWGDGYNGNLGDGVPCDPAGPCMARTPVEVAGLTGVTAMATFEWGAYALRSDGTVWAWGNNAYQSLANESVAGFAPTPIRIPVLTDIHTIGGGSLAGYAVVPNP
jgi:alpha-tubulin suppressor-like RCC1 family protein